MSVRFQPFRRDYWFEVNYPQRGEERGTRVDKWYSCHVDTVCTSYSTTSLKDLRYNCVGPGDGEGSKDWWDIVPRSRLRVKEGHQHDVHFPTLFTPPSTPESAGAPLRSDANAKKKIVTAKMSSALGKRDAPSKRKAKVKEKFATKNDLDEKCDAPSKSDAKAKDKIATERKSSAHGGNGATTSHLVTMDDCVDLSITRLKLQVVVRKKDSSKSDRYWYDFELQKKLRSFVEIERWLKTAYPIDLKLHGIWLATLKEECTFGGKKVIEATRLHLAAVNASRAASKRPAKAFEKVATSITTTSAKNPMKASDEIAAKSSSSAPTALKIVSQESALLPFHVKKTGTKKRKTLDSGDKNKISKTRMNSHQLLRVNRASAETELGMVDTDMQLQSVAVSCHVVVHGPSARIVLAQTGSNVPRIVFIRWAQPPSPDTSEIVSGRLESGSVLVRVGNENVCGKSLDMVVNTIQGCTRPMHLYFSKDLGENGMI